MFFQSKREILKNTIERMYVSLFKKNKKVTSNEKGTRALEKEKRVHHTEKTFKGVKKWEAR